MTTGEGLTVGAVADLVGVSVRTLHHWDRIGLAPASGRTWSGYRVYDDDDDVARLKEAITMSSPLTSEDRAEVFGTDWNEGYQVEAEERWGDTPQWEQSQARTSTMSKDDWKRVKAEGDALNADLAAAKRAGVQPGSSEAAELAERHRASISEFYDCTHSMQVCLARMYRQDPRFTETYDTLEPGLAEWLGAVVDANARAHGVDPETATWS